MKRYIKIFAVVGLAILIGSLTVVFGQTKTTKKSQFTQDEKQEFGKVPLPFGFGWVGLNTRSLDWLNLTDEQKTQIQTLEENARGASKVYFEKMQVVQEKIKDTTEDESFDETAARQLLKTKATFKSSLKFSS